MAQKEKRSFAQKVFIMMDKMFDKAQNEQPLATDDTIEEILDIQYDTEYPESGKLDLYFKKSADATAKMPVMFYIHGGGFVAGDKHYRRWLSRFYANLGLFVVNVNYALGPKYKFPIGLNQLYRALEWVGANADTYNLDLDKVFVGGDSAGGYYGAHLAAVANNPDMHATLNYNGSVRFYAAILNCGMFDLEVALNKHYIANLNVKLCRDVLGVTPDEVTTIPTYGILSPAKLLTADFPQCLLIYAEKDIFCAGQTQNLQALLESNGVKVATYNSTKLTDNHCFCLSPNASPACKEAIAIIAEYVKGLL